MVKKIEVQGSEITVISKHGQDYISLTDMLKAKDGGLLHFRLVEEQEYC